MFKNTTILGQSIRVLVLIFADMVQCYKTWGSIGLKMSTKPFKYVMLALQLRFDCILTIHLHLR